MKYKRFEGESPIEFQFRVSKDKELIGTWQDVADICNKELGHDYTECKYRKDYASFVRIFEANQTQLVDPDERLGDIERRELDLRKRTQKFNDQKREFNKQITHEARTEHLENELVRAAERLQDICPMLAGVGDDDDEDDEDKTVEAVLFFADWHYGMVTDNIYNVYNKDVCKRRVRQLVKEASERLRLHRPSLLHIVLLGDAAHGGIHVSARVRSEEMVCDQLMQVSELMAEAIQELSTVVPDICVYTTYGNHMRTIQNKKESVHADNMERIIGWWLRERFKDNPRIEVIYSTQEFVDLDVCGHTMLCVHGDLDSIHKVGPLFNTLFTQRYGLTVEYTVSADKHHIEELDVLGIEHTIVPSLCGTDDYANQHRLYSKPGQTLMIFNQNGKDATYHIKLS